ncbi:MAG TPA: hypothetical protein VNZ52_00530 [Candidatus Thermoplasmatota archaeon]|nr:hypothetical protein [Candidatus Thermoplasmatota archaeon]
MPHVAFGRAVALLGLLLVVAAGSASAAAFESSFTDPTGDPAYNDGQAAGPDYAHADIVKVETREIEGVVVVQVTFQEPPSGSSTYYLTVDFEGNEDPDLAFQSDATGSFRNVPVYWKSYPRISGNILSFPLESNEADESAFRSAGKWRVTTGAVTMGAGLNTVSDVAAGGPAGSGSRAVPAPSLLPAAVVVLGAAVLLARRSR